MESRPADTDKAHWEHVYTTKAADAVSWFQAHALTSVRLIRSLVSDLDAPILDVGGGASTLVDDLLDAGYRDLTVLDISRAALEKAQARLGERAAQVRWIEADLLRADLPRHRTALWHDRAVFHFLTTAEARATYVEQVARAVRPGGHVIVATFGSEGPERCSGLPTVRYDPEGLHDEFGARFALLGHEEEAHPTPFGTVQQFMYCYCRREG